LTKSFLGLNSQLRQGDFQKAKCFGSFGLKRSGTGLSENVFGKAASDDPDEIQDQERRRKMTKKHFSLTVVTAALFAVSIFLTACSGGGGGAAGGGSTAGVSGGEIERLGSIFVNGVEFETTDAVVKIEDGPGQLSDLQEGKIAKVEGAFSDDGVTGRADEVRLEDIVEGPIAAVTETTAGLVKTMIVMGQTVVVENNITVFDSTLSFAALGPASVGSVVEVSGNPRPDGSVQATFIESKLAGGVLEVQGIVQNLTATTFQINALTIDFSGVVPRNGVLANGVPAETKGTVFDGTTLIATDVEVKAGGFADLDIPKAEVEGFVTNLTGSTMLVAGQPVDFGSASFRGGLENELVNGMKVEAEGPISGGVLIAVKVTFKESVRFEANIETVDAVGGTLTLQGLPGFTIITDSNITRFDAALNTLAIGNNMRVRGRMSGEAGTIMATRIEKQSDTPDNRLIIQGLVDTFSGDSISIMGINVDTSTIPDGGFKAEDDAVIGRTGFMNQLAVGALVKARRTVDGATGALGAWTEIELED